MSSTKDEEVRRWLYKSRQDLGAARRLLEGDAPFLDAAVFHSQQAAEKAVKAYLTHHEVRFPRTHDLTELLARAAKRDVGFDEWQPIAEELTPYAVQFRYPSHIMEPTFDEAEAALKNASGLVKFVVSLLRTEAEELGSPGR